MKKSSQNCFARDKMIYLQQTDVNFFFGPRLMPHWVTAVKSFLTIIFRYVWQTPPDISEEIEKI